MDTRFIDLAITAALLRRAVYGLQPSTQYGPVLQTGPYNVLITASSLRLDSVSLHWTPKSPPPRVAATRVTHD